MPSPEEVYALIAHEVGAVWLDGGNASTGWTILAYSPRDLWTETGDWRVAGRTLSQTEHRDSKAPFHGGCIGYIGYGAGHHVAPVPQEQKTWEPSTWLGRYDGALCFEHATGQWYCTGTQESRQRGQALLEQAKPLQAPSAARTAARERTVDKDDYMEQVRRIQQWLFAGDCYQINLTRPIWLTDVGDAWQAYRRLRHRSSPQYGAFLRLKPQLSILCNSPELLMRYSNGHVSSEPIKGTRPRGVTETEDARLVDELMRATKDNAELTMIVDLVRNDLGRVATIGSVHTERRRVQSHANVHHASQVVEAQVRNAADPWATLGVLFPPGSVTGAPKIRACQRISELEHSPRGVYCGAVGYVSGAQSVFNVAIRTTVWREEDCRFHVGGGIVVDSTPDAEWKETQDKASAMYGAFSAQ